MATGQTLQADVGAQAHDDPLPAAAGVRLAQPDHVVQINFEHHHAARVRRKPLIAPRIDSAAARAAACQSLPRDAYRIARLDAMSTPPPSASWPSPTAMARSPPCAPTPGTSKGTVGARARTLRN